MKTAYQLILPYVKDKKVLDIGSCGNQGENQKSKTLFTLLKSQADHVTGVDLESNDPEIIQGNAETIQLKKKFDLVVAGDVIEHLHNPGLFLDNMYSHLEDNGLIILVTPNAKSIGYLPFKGNAFHTCWYCKHTLKYLVNQHGFKVERIWIGLRKKRGLLNNLFRHYFANNLLFVCRKVNKD